MILVKCSECAVEFEFPLFTPSPDKELRCINCEDSPVRLALWLRAVKDPIEKKQILNRLAALKNKPKRGKFILMV